MKSIYRPKTRVYAALISTVVLYSIFAAGSVSPVNPSDIESMIENFRELIETIDSALDIFLNNFLISLIMLVPGVGLIIGGWIVYSTGLVVSAFATSQGVSSLLLLIIPILTIYGVLEFIGYGVMVSENVLVLYAIRKKELRSELKFLPIIIGIGAASLGLAAIIEYYLISIFQ